MRFIFLNVVLKTKYNYMYEHVNIVQNTKQAHNTWLFYGSEREPSKCWGIILISTIMPCSKCVSSVGSMEENLRRSWANWPTGMNYEINYFSVFLKFLRIMWLPLFLALLIIYFVLGSLLSPLQSYNNWTFWPPGVRCYDYPHFTEVW